jgi:hypothetical protein
MSWERYVAFMLDIRTVYRVSVGKSEGKSPRQTRRFRREYNIRMHLEEIG